MIVPENNNLNQDDLNQHNPNDLSQTQLNQNDLNHEDSEDTEGKEDRENRKTIYKETPDPINEDKKDNGDSSSVIETGRTSLVNRPQRDNTPLGSGHEPGTMPGGNNF
ncbi:hypothetical protein GCM10011387_25410 [Pedobacter quisquiliarum]|uniref:Uncharacterized protein n=1 Tax=Pedobacter quisquiliarum TaxID=1834438 RepID=A0A916UEN1_9SPHI|nr:hypothetical protein [Pedobacter quisquiliarum]GGC70856.1 hypothetical protein GCM10011387_25410 [Pedobacter quisquiliarum]